MQRVRLIGSIAVMTACLVAAGCGGSDDSASDSSSSADPAAAAEDRTASASDAEESAGSPAEGGGGASSDVPRLEDGPWEGTLQVGVSGDADVNLDMFGGGSATNGSAVLIFVSDDGSGSQIGFSHEDGTDSVILVNTADLTTGGTVGKECSVSVSESSAGSVAGEFSCQGVPGASRDARELTLDLEGTFALEKS